MFVGLGDGVFIGLGDGVFVGLGNGVFVDLGDMSGGALRLRRIAKGDSTATSETSGRTATGSGQICKMICCNFSLLMIPISYSFVIYAISASAGLGGGRPDFSAGRRAVGVARRGA